jgi:hypothetical protein
MHGDGKKVMFIGERIDCHVDVVLRMFVHVSQASQPARQKLTKEKGAKNVSSR